MNTFKFLRLFALITALFLCFSFQIESPKHKTIAPPIDSIVDEEVIDTVWNVVVYVEFHVDSNGHIHDVVAEKQFDCFMCDSSMINQLKKQAVESVEAMPKWDNYQQKEIIYEIPVHMVKTHPHKVHHVYHHVDSAREDLN